MADIPDWYDDLDGTLRHALGELSAAVSDRGHGFRTFTVASVDANGEPSARVVVLRAFDRDSWQLRFHTDGRSRKVSEFAENGRVSLVFYDKGRKLQIRLGGRAEVHKIDPSDKNGLAAEAFTASLPMSRECYRIEPGPGTVLGAPDGYRHADVSQHKNGDIAADPGASHFAAVVVAFETAEVLYLASEGHRRSRFRDVGNGIHEGVWLTP
ncbi:Flavin Mononucleotide Binding Protein [Fulvimarina pelagi HTCC2506]|uniref:Flavin Mononucleotide Binding Protein n=1 Tax=Fulvimarina pelagi HTCC2506 TaxID=314231 RepID=Q0G1Z3_9HYPH|nr:pyridoxamine 5'-phosphate oxidase family protein [Fulvimarina pelagi]EAU41405.1 Flavin Mononucleotide Binding Protein [Fulvimarina pelagi HTCC2506]